jgi:hypothetical protein
MELNITDGKITRIDTQGYNFCDDAYDLGTTRQGSFFAAVSKGTAAATKGQIVLIPTQAVLAIYIEVENAEQQNTSEDKA